MTTKQLTTKSTKSIWLEEAGLDQTKNVSQVAVFVC